MKKLLLLLLMMWGVAQAQVIPGYTTVNHRYRNLSDAPVTFLIPSGDALPSSADVWNRSGRMFYDSSGVDSGLYVYHRPYWVKVGGGATTSTLQEIFNNETRKSVLTAQDTIKMYSTGFVWTQAGQDSTVAAITIDLASPGSSNVPGKFNLRARNYGGVGFKYEGRDPGFVRNQVDNIINPDSSAAHGIPYANSLAGYSARCTNFSGVMQIGIGVGGSYYADSSVFFFGQNVRSMKLATNANQPIRFSGGVLESTTDWGQWAGSGHFMINTAVDLGNKFLNVKGSSYLHDTLFLKEAPRVSDTTGYDILMRSRTGEEVVKMYAGLLPTGGGGSTNTSIGSGYKVAVNSTNNIKSLSAKYGISLDSATTGEIGIGVDSSTLLSQARTFGWLRTPSTVADGTNVLGTLNNKSMIFYTNNTRVGKWDSTGALSINLTTPNPSILGTNDAKLLVQGTVGLYESGALKTYWGLSSSNSQWVMRNSSSQDAIKLITTTGGSSWIGLDNTVKVGIGTNAPTHALTVSGQVKIFAPQAGDTAPDSIATFKDGILSATPMVLASGESTPTLTSVANVSSSSANSGALFYTRTGNYVNFTLIITVTPTANTTTTQIDFSLPIASNFGATSDMHGNGTVVGSSYGAVFVSGDNTNDRGHIEFTSSSTSAHTVTISGQYKVI